MSSSIVDKDSCALNRLQQCSLQEQKLTDNKLDLALLGPWEYWFDRGLFDFGDKFYAICGTNVSKEGRFLTLESYVKEFVHPEDKEIARNMLANLLDIQNLSMAEFRIIRRDKAVRTIRIWRVSWEELGNAKKIYGVVRDVTELKLLEEELLASRKQLSVAMKLATIGPWEYDLKTNLFKFSEEFYAVYGTALVKEGRYMTPEAYVREFVHPDDAKYVAEAIYDREPEIRSKRTEHRIIRRDGQVRTISVYSVISSRDDAGNILKICGGNQDITERVLMENALRESEGRQRATLNALPDLILRMDASGKLFDYRIPDNYSCYLARKTDTYERIDDLFCAPLANLVKKLVISSVRLGETQITNYSDLIYNTVCNFTIRTATINTNQVLVIIKDQTALYRAQREVQRLENLNLIGEMAASIGHELRNPLTTVRGYLQFLSRKEQYGELHDVFRVMIGELDRSNSIITELLALAKNKAVKLELININSIITAIYPLFAAEAIASNKVVFLELAPDLPEILVDQGDFKQLLLNLVRNGLEAMRDKGKLTISTIQDNTNVSLRVRDEGPGIPDSVLEKIGTPFITTKDTGTGIGLSICYSIAARHDAIIDYTTGPGGTEFIVRFNSEESFGKIPNNNIIT